ncbi:kinase-like domain-containing protein [Trichoderma ceciliae]
MSTPTSFFVPPPDASEISARLQEEMQRQEEATPEPVFRNKPVEQAYGWLCKIHHGNFTHEEIDELRMGIRDATYWQREAEYFQAICVEQIRKNHDRCASSNTDAAFAWRSRCLDLRQLLKEMGVDSQEFHLQRLSIADQNYWKSEADRLKHILAARELEMQAQFLAEVENNHGIPSLPENGIKPSRKGKSSQNSHAQSRRPQKKIEPRRSARLQGLNASRVGKRRGRVGGKVGGKVGEGTENILEFSDNKRFEFTPPKEGQDEGTGWRGEQGSVKLTGPCLCFVFGLHMFSPGGWICGSLPDSEQCDLQLAKGNENGVSRRHFRIDVSPISHRPRLTNMSQNPIHISGDNGAALIQLDPDDQIDIESSVTIDLGVVRLRAWRPLLSADQEQRYKKNAQKYHREYMSALPRPAADTSNKTSSIRFGPLTNNAYKTEGPAVGSGSFASVFKVRALKSGKCFAAKVPHYKESDAPGKVRDRWESLSKEFQKLTALKHAHIVQAIEVLVGRHEAEPPWLIMEWIPLDLRAVSLEDDDIPELLHQVSSGLLFMHDSGFAHRDLKPENILILENKQGLFAKIADVGLSKYSTHGQMQTFAGSLVYMAPEIWSVASYTNAVDMWSLGIIAVELWTRWDLLSGESKRMQLDKSEQQIWIRNSVKPRIDLAPVAFRPVLHGLLSESTRERWEARRCEEWLRANTQAHVSMRQATHMIEEDIRRARSSHFALSTKQVSNVSLSNLITQNTELRNPIGSDAASVDD